VRHGPNPSGAAWLSRAASRGPSEARLNVTCGNPFCGVSTSHPYPRGSVTANQHSVADDHRPRHRRTPDRRELCSNRAVLEMAIGLDGRQGSP
jgi:hypothetical protein